MKRRAALLGLGALAYVGYEQLKSPSKLVLPDGRNGISGDAQAVTTAILPTSIPPQPGEAVAQAPTVIIAPEQARYIEPLGLRRYHETGSTQKAQSPRGLIQLWERPIGGAIFKYIIAYPGPDMLFNPFHANGMIPTNKSGNTRWKDRPENERNRQTVEAMHKDPRNILPGFTLWTSFIGDYFGNWATEGTSAGIIGTRPDIGTNPEQQGEVFMVNPQRSATIFRLSHEVLTGVFTHDDIQRLGVYAAIGAGPNTLVFDRNTGRVVRTHSRFQRVDHPDGTYEHVGKFNYWDEYFPAEQHKKRISTYEEPYPSTYIGHGKDDDGRTFVAVGSISGQVDIPGGAPLTGWDLMLEFYKMKVESAMALDSGGSNQIYYRGIGNLWLPFFEPNYREVAQSGNFFERD
jgi:hypothetical protein